MGKILVLAEKPSVARDIANILSCRDRKDGYIEGEHYIVSWCIGHLVTLYEPSDYDEALKVWSFDTLPIIPNPFKLKANSSTVKQFNVVKKLMNNSTIDSWILATDSGREGELIGRYCKTLANCNKPFKRLWINSMTDQAIKEGFENLKPSSNYDNLYYSAKCRSESDWIVGMNASRAFSIKYNSNLSIGRVQTPTLSLIVTRQMERENFVPRDYWTIKALYDGFNGIWFDKQSNDTKLFDRNKANNIVEQIKGQRGVIQDIENTKKKESAPQLFDLTEIQRTCNRKFGFTAQKALDMVQSLYEKKLVTYPRTDSKYISDDVVPTLKTRVAAVNFSPYCNIVSYIMKSTIKLTKRYVDNTKINDHHAIIPTNQKADFESLSEDERKVYGLIVKRFLSIFLPAYEYMSTTIITSIGNELFKSTGKTVLNNGWMALYKNDKGNQEEDKEEDNSEQELPKLSINQEINVNDILLEQKQTKPPQSYNESSLLSAMEHAGNFVEDEELKEQLKEGGLGTPATRAAIIERLIKVGYVVREKKNLIPTDKGIKLISILPNEIKSPELTGRWEKALSKMAKGEYSSTRFMDSIVNYTNFLLAEAKKETNIQFDKNTEVKGKNSREKEVVGRCKICGGNVVKNSKGWGCSNWKEKGCTFFISKQNPYLAKFNKEVTSTLVKALLKSDKSKITITNKKANTKLEKIVTLVNEGRYWNLKFEDAK